MAPRPSPLRFVPLLAAVALVPALGSVASGATAAPAHRSDRLPAGVERELVGDDAYVEHEAGTSLPVTRQSATGGYALLGGVSGYLLGAYTIYLVDSPGIEGVRGLTEAAAGEIAKETGLTVTVAPGTIADGIDQPGEIYVRTADSSPCGPLSLPGIAGCGGPSTLAGRITSGDVSLARQIPCDSVATSVVAHELGHAFGLAHYTGTVGGLLQLMYPSTDSDAPTFRAGDRAGLRTLAGRAAIVSPIGAAATSSPAGLLSGAPSAAAGVPVAVAAAGAPLAVTTGSLFSQPAVQRVLDTRTGVSLSGRFASGTNRTLSLSPWVGAAQVDAVVLNLTATGANGRGYVTAYPTGSALPKTSSANYESGVDAANLVIVKLGANNSVDLYNSGADVDLLGDLFGVFSSAGTEGFVASNPTRVMDTRESAVPNERGFPLGCSDWKEIDTARLTGAGLPTGTASAAVINLTAANTTAGGFVSLLASTTFPAPGSTPSTSNLNLAARDTRANLAITPGTDWLTQLGPSLASDVIADLAGWFVSPAVDPAAARFAPSDPTRILDTRIGLGLSGRFGPDQKRSLPIPLPAGVSADQVTAVVVNVTAVEPNAGGYLTLWPTGVAQPTASNVNYDSGEVVPNLAIVKLGTGASIDIYSSSGSPNGIVDVLGWFVRG